MLKSLSLFKRSYIFLSYIDKVAFKQARLIHSKTAVLMLLSQMPRKEEGCSLSSSRDHVLPCVSFSWLLQAEKHKGNLSYLHIYQSDDFLSRNHALSYFTWLKTLQGIGILLQLKGLVKAGTAYTVRRVCLISCVVARRLGYLILLMLPVWQFLKVFWL